MNSSFIGKIEKAKRYSQEGDRVKLRGFEATFRGDHDIYEVSHSGEKWYCNCHFFRSYDTCSHTMALERMLYNTFPNMAKVNKD